MSHLQDLFYVPTAGPCWVASPATTCWLPQVQVFYPATTSDDSINLSGDVAAGWVIEAAKKLESLARFRTGWDSYGGLPLKREARGLTMQVLGWLQKYDLPVPAVVLGSAGTVQLEWRDKGKELEVELRDNNTIEYLKVHPNGEIEEGEAAVDPSGRVVHDLTRWLQYC
jgi:hypothetical protein